MSLSFQPRGAFRFLIDGTPLIRRIHAAADRDQVARIPVTYGNAAVDLGELFRVEWAGNDGTTHWTGDLRNMAGLGSRQSFGETFVEGSIGSRTGAMMTGGQIVVIGDAGDDLGMGMTGGTIGVSGNVGDRVGGCLLGEAQGMRGGLICVGGNVGCQAGLRMLTGTIVIGGSADAGLGFQMRAGTLIVNRPVTDALGFEMVRGTIVCLDPMTDLGQSLRFRCSGEFQLEVGSVLAQALMTELERISHTTPAGPLHWNSIQHALSQLNQATWRLYYGDHLQEGKGEVLVSALTSNHRKTGQVAAQTI